MNLPPTPPPPPQDDDPIITEFKPAEDQWELDDTNIKRIDDDDQTILHNYCEHINTTPLEVYRYLIEKKGCDVNARDGYNNTLLDHVLDNFDPNDGGDITVLRYLLNQKIDISDGGGNTLLLKACVNINKLPAEIFQYLVETLGCDINAKDDDNNTPLDHVLDNFDPNNGGDITVLRYLLSLSNVNTEYDSGYTVLHHACEQINYLPLDVFKVLIETHGDDINVHDNNNDTPIHFALDFFNPSEGGDINVLAYLINQQNVNINAKYKRDHTLLHTACIVNLQNTWHSAELNAGCDTILCQIVEVIISRCLELVLGGTAS